MPERWGALLGACALAASVPSVGAADAPDPALLEFLGATARLEESGLDVDRLLAERLVGPRLNECFALVGDVGTLDIVRGRDHGMPSYSDMRILHGLSPVTSFTALTGETSDAFPLDDPPVDVAAPLDDSDILDYVALTDADGAPIELGSEAAGTEAVEGVRRTTLAARLKAIHGDVERLDAFVGMVSEPHLPGSDLGELQHTMWKAQFEALRDGDRFHCRWSRPLRLLERALVRARPSCSPLTRPVDPPDSLAAGRCAPPRRYHRV